MSGDGLLDMVMTDSNASSVAVLLGNGDGSFQAVVKYPVGWNPLRIAVGDFNGDGKPDVVGGDAGSLHLLRGKGDGSFLPAVSHAMGSMVRAHAVAAGDFNGDNKLDLAVGSDDVTGTFPQSNVLVFLGGGDGTFQPPSSLKVVDSPTSMAVGDLNGDGKLDLIAVGHGASYSPGGTSVLIGNGNGTFQTAVNYPGQSLTSVVMGDFNRDGKTDFATVWSDDIAGTPITVWLNTSCTPSPRLALARHGNALSISWPFSSVGFALESTTNLTRASWNPIDAAPINRNGRWEWMTPATQSQAFYRLRKR